MGYRDSRSLDYPDRIALDSIYEGKYRNAKELE